MLNAIIRWVLLALAVMLVAFIVPGIQVGGFLAALIAALVIGIINLFIRPIVMALTLPINLLTLGLFTFVINALLLWFVGAITPGFTVEGFVPALLGSLLLSILSVLINWTSAQVQHAT
ncbi:MAG: hypothetical protein A2104_01765 [Candidatus Melainabacteria bacterium GWF2_32_7]|nr:MAG: hypothetical protein A2104_01765 [Candidatus Melainabacteria bacterium GWF2_32_7]